MDKFSMKKLSISLIIKTPHTKTKCQKILKKIIVHIGTLSDEERMDIYLAEQAQDKEEEQAPNNVQTQTNSNTNTNGYQNGNGNEGIYM